MQKFAKLYFAPNTHKSHLGVSHDQNVDIVGVQKAHFVGQKCQNICNKFVLLQMAQTVIWVVSHDQHFPNLHIWEIQNTHLEGPKCQHFMFLSHCTLALYCLV